ncbi:hypothetical protein GGR51DRAFT_516293 [Nemania sp. FL0031]|nr:hypothetical protein GGR51DRAFT_516293 [Nemania sp. FL0031]
MQRRVAQRGAPSVAKQTAYLITLTRTCRPTPTPSHYARSTYLTLQTYTAYFGSRFRGKASYLPIYLRYLFYRLFGRSSHRRASTQPMHLGLLTGDSALRKAGCASSYVRFSPKGTLVLSPVIAQSYVSKQSATTQLHPHGSLPSRVPCMLCTVSSVPATVSGRRTIHVRIRNGGHLSDHAARPRALSIRIPASTLFGGRNQGCMRIVFKAPVSNLTLLRFFVMI